MHYKLNNASQYKSRDKNEKKNIYIVIKQPNTTVQGYKRLHLENELSIL